MRKKWPSFKDLPPACWYFTSILTLGRGKKAEDEMIWGSAVSWSDLAAHTMHWDRCFVGLYVLSFKEFLPHFCMIQVMLNLVAFPFSFIWTPLLWRLGYVLQHVLNIDMTYLPPFHWKLQCTPPPFYKCPVTSFYNGIFCSILFHSPHNVAACLYSFVFALHTFWCLRTNYSFTFFHHHGNGG